MLSHVLPVTAVCTATHRQACRLQASSILNHEIFQEAWMKICYAGTAVFLTVTALVSGCAIGDARYAYPYTPYETDARYGYSDARYGYPDARYGYPDTRYGTDTRYGYPDTRYGTDTRYGYPDARYASTSYTAYGVVDAIDMTSSNRDPHNVAGTVIGGVIGGVLGHQVGSGRGNSVATVAGAVGGAVVGHEVEESTKRQDLYRVRIRLEGGGYQTFMQDTLGSLRVGDRVRVDNDRVSRY
jgi:outer membrane lipoprotein SlyB